MSAPRDEAAPAHHPDAFGFTVEPMYFATILPAVIGYLLWRLSQYERLEVDISQIDMPLRGKSLDLKLDEFGTVTFTWKTFAEGVAESGQDAYVGGVVVEDGRRRH